MLALYISAVGLILAYAVVYFLSFAESTQTEERGGNNFYISFELYVPRALFIARSFAVHSRSDTFALKPYYDTPTHIVSASKCRLT